MLDDVLSHVRRYIPGPIPSTTSQSLGGSLPSQEIFQDRKVPLDSGTCEPDDAAGFPESCVQPGLLVGKDADELEGEVQITNDVRISGGYADVHQAVWNRRGGDQLQVAVKVFKAVFPTSITMDPTKIKERMEKRLKREILVWTSVNHPNIHPLLGFQSQPSPRLISAWCSHGNLTDYLLVNPDLSRLRKIQLIADVARGLAYLHSHTPPICHADIKPENVLVNDSCSAALSDFGLSRVLEVIGAPCGLTTGEGPKGSPHYVAPELFEEENPRPTPKSDVFAFGGLVLAVMSGKPPFAHQPYARIMYFVLQGRPPKREDHPLLEPQDMLWSLIIRCRERDVYLRPEMSDILKQLEREVSSLARPLEAARCPVALVPGGRGPSVLLQSGRTLRPVSTDELPDPREEVRERRDNIVISPPAWRSSVTDQYRSFSREGRFRQVVDPDRDTVPRRGV